MSTNKDEAQELTPLEEQTKRLKELKEVGTALNDLGTDIHSVMITDSDGTEVIIHDDAICQALLKKAGQKTNAEFKSLKAEHRKAVLAF